MPGPIEIIAGEPARLAVGTQVRLAPAIDPLIAEGERVMGICNSCRYCEGYCAVFPAMERRTTFTKADVHYLANLCHNCAECYYACQYAPPHEFAVNVPKVFAEVRRLLGNTDAAFDAMTALQDAGGSGPALELFSL